MLQRGFRVEIAAAFFPGGLIHGARSVRVTR